MTPLGRLRLHLAAWYAGTFGALLLVLGTVLAHVLAGQLDRDLELELTALNREVEHGARLRLADGLPADRAIRESLGELASPNRSLYLFDRTGKLLEPEETPDPVVQDAAARALTVGVATASFTTEGQDWRLRARRVFLGRNAFVVASLADAGNLDAKVRRLIETLIGAGLLAVVPLLIGGYHLARLSTRPVEEAFEHRRRFVAEAAHELRTPLAILRAETSTLVAQARDAEADGAALQRIDDEAARLGRIADDLFTLARADAGESPRPQAVYLDDVASDAVEAAGALATQRGVRLELGRFEEAPVKGDPELIRRLVLILLDNALKYTPAGGQVRVDVVHQDGHSVLSVNDTGIGMGPEDLSRIFDRFYRGARARAQAGGAGLGLSIAHWIAAAHGAVIDVDSGPGRGTRMRVRFPDAAER
jgi:signal transduction histidine kinase